MKQRPFNYLMVAAALLIGAMAIASCSSHDNPIEPEPMPAPPTDDWYENLHWYDKYEEALEEVGAQEKQVVLPNERIINYGEVENDKPALLLIHGQMSIWQDYALVLPKLSEKWHIYAVDVYGHGQSTHDESLYYLDVNSDDLIWFIDHVIRAPTVVAGHSNGAITTAYIAANGGRNVVGAVLEDPPIFSTEGEGWEQHFSYLDTFKPLHEYNLSDKSECWEAWYLRHCYWGQVYMKDMMPGIADYAQQYHDEHPGEAVKIGFLPSSIWYVFEYVVYYDMAYGEHFYDLSWNHGLKHKDILSSIDVPCVYIHAKEGIDVNGVYTCAATREQAERAVSYIGDNCRLVETDTSDHTIHTVHSDVFIEAVNSLHK
jgi:pimeloyl-ACP methyl ester carboxylesterase